MDAAVMVDTTDMDVANIVSIANITVPIIVIFTPV